MHFQSIGMLFRNVKGVFVKRSELVQVRACFGLNIPDLSPAMDFPPRSHFRTKCARTHTSRRPTVGMESTSHFVSKGNYAWQRQVDAMYADGTLLGEARVDGRDSGPGRERHRCA